MTYTYDYPRPMVTVDTLLIANSLNSYKVLLIKRGNDPFKGMWALPGGFVEMDENLETAALRELREETGIELGELKQLHTFGKPGRDPRGRNITIVFTAMLNNCIKAKSGDDAADAKWFNISKLPELAFDHEDVIKLGLINYKVIES